MDSLINELKITISNIKNNDEWEKVRIEYLGKKGKITKLFQGINKIIPAKKKSYGLKINALRSEVNKLLVETKEEINKYEITQIMLDNKVDISLPGVKSIVGFRHPLTIITNQICSVLQTLGYSIELGSEVVDNAYNFEKLNIPQDHPARDMQDTFYLDINRLLRSHTSPVQIQAMEGNPKMPIKIICPGKVYRRDDDDATHLHQFMQIEGLFIDENVSLADLKGTILYLIKKIFGNKKEIRFRASYFPFTEPSVEVDISCMMCDGKGCFICKKTGWIEILGAGMVHTNVLIKAGIDHNKYQGFAFGIGIERVAMLKYGVSDIRNFYNNDLRFIKQFKEES